MTRYFVDIINRRVLFADRFGVEIGEPAELRVEGRGLAGNGFAADIGHVAATASVIFSADDGCDIGRDTGSPVSPDYGPQGNAFNGTVRGVQLAVAEAAEDSDHLVMPEEAMRVAMARQ